MLYPMSYGHHHGILKTVVTNSPDRGGGIGRGREIRTPDILLPKQARYQTALYPELNTPHQKGQGPRPRFQDAHDTHTPDKRQRHSDDFTTVCAA